MFSGVLRWKLVEKYVFFYLEIPEVTFVRGQELPCTVSTRSNSVDICVQCNPFFRIFLYIDIK